MSLRSFCYWSLLTLLLVLSLGDAMLERVICEMAIDHHQIPIAKDSSASQNGIAHTMDNNVGGVDLPGGSVSLSTSPTGRGSAIAFLNLLSNPSSISVTPELYSDGFFAAIRGSYGASMIGDVSLNIVEPAYPDGSVSDNLDAALNLYPNLLGVLGPLGDETLAEVLAYNEAHNLQLTAIGPYTRYASSVGWNPNKYFIRVPPAAEMYAIATHLVASLHVQRVGLMSIVGCPTSDEMHGTIINSLRLVHNIVPIEFKQSVEVSSLDMNEFNAFLEKRPQVVIVNAGSCATVGSMFVEQFSTNPQAIGIPLYVNSASFHLSHDILNKGLPHDFYFTWTNDMANDTDMSYIFSFEEDMRSFLASGEAKYFHSYEDVRNSIFNGLTVYGWLIGQVLLKSIQDPVAVLDRSSFQSSLFDQRQYNIGKDNLIGPFGGTCYGKDFTLQKTCRCNEGGHVINVYHANKGQSAYRSLKFSLPRQKCASDNFTLPFFNQAALLFHKDYPDLLSVAQNLMYGTSLVVATQDLTKEVLVPAAIDMSKYKNLTAYVQDNIVDVIIGPVMTARKVANELSDVLIIDPIDLYPIPRMKSPLVVYLMPTMDQQIYIFAEVAKTNGYTCAVVLRRSPEYDAICTIIHNAASKYSIKIQIYTVEEGEHIVDLSATLRQDFVMLIGIHKVDLPFMLVYLEKHPSAKLVVLFEEFTVVYRTLMATFQDVSTEVQKRLLTQTNLPTWTDYTEETASAYPGLKAYHDSFPNTSLTTPASLQAWYTANIVQQMTSARFNNMAMTLEESVYFSSTYVYGNLTISKLELPNKHSNVIRNYGACDISMISIAHVANQNVPVSYGPFSPDMSISLLSSLDITLILAVCIPLIIAICSTAGLLSFTLCCRVTEPKPPRNPNRPVTLLVCDIYRSSGLWASHPREMLKATHAYQFIVRELIRDLHCYEVKLIGDAFLIASNNTVDIVNLSVSVQRALYEHDWGTLALDAFYIRNLKDAALSFKKKEGSFNDAFLKHLGNASNDTVLTEYEIRELVESEPYCHMWNGLRVRMGIHTGLCQMSSNEGAKGVDYHGDTVHITARTERCARGGQILMTQSTWEHLRDSDLLSSLYADIAVSDAGARSLRGVPLPVQMYEVETIEGREWRQNLSEEVQYPLQQYSLDEDNVDLLSDSHHCDECYTSEAHRVHRFVTGLFFPLSTSAKLAQITVLMDQWHIPTLVSPPNTNDDDKLSILLCRFANRTANMFALQESVALAHESNKRSLSSLESASGRCACQGISCRPNGNKFGLARVHSSDSYDIMHPIPEGSKAGGGKGGDGCYPSGLPPPDGFSHLAVSFPDGVGAAETDDDLNDDGQSKMKGDGMEVDEDGHIIFPMPLVSGVNSTMTNTMLVTPPPQFQYDYDNPLEKVAGSRKRFDSPPCQLPVSGIRLAGSPGVVPAFSSTCSGGDASGTGVTHSSSRTKKKKSNSSETETVICEGQKTMVTEKEPQKVLTATVEGTVILPLELMRDTTEKNGAVVGASSHYSSHQNNGTAHHNADPTTTTAAATAPGIGGRPRKNSVKRVTLALQTDASSNSNDSSRVQPHPQPSANPRSCLRKLSSLQGPSTHHPPPPVLSILLSPSSSPPAGGAASPNRGGGALGSVGSVSCFSPRGDHTTGSSGGMAPPGMFADLAQHPSPTNRFYPLCAMRRHTDHILMSSGVNAHDPSIREFCHVVAEVEQQQDSQDPKDQRRSASSPFHYDRQEKEKEVQKERAKRTRSEGNPMHDTRDCADGENLTHRYHCQRESEDGNHHHHDDDEESLNLVLEPSSGSSSTADLYYLRNACSPLPQVFVFPSPRQGSTAAVPPFIQTDMSNNDNNDNNASNNNKHSHITHHNSSTVAPFVPLSTPAGERGAEHPVTTSGSCFAGLAGVDYSFT